MIRSGACSVGCRCCRVGTVGDALRFSGGDGADVAVLSLMLPGGVLLTPFVGRLIDKLGPWPSLAATNALGLLQAAACLWLPLSLQPIAFAAYGTWRTVARGGCGRHACERLGPFARSLFLAK